VAVTVAPETRGRAHLDVGAVADGQHLVDHDLLTHIRSNLFYFKFFAAATRYCLPPVFMTAYI
jgi:hypothetical protein